MKPGSRLSRVEFPPALNGISVSWVLPGSVLDTPLIANWLSAVLATSESVVPMRLMKVKLPVESVTPVWPTPGYIVEFACKVTLGAGWPLESKTMTDLLILPNNKANDVKMGFPFVSIANTDNRTEGEVNPVSVIFEVEFVVSSTGAPLARIV
jgi:hypothetical protein